MNLEGKSSPWGVIQHETIIADGISSVSTPGHGGIKLDRRRNAKVPDYMRNSGGWYEEDCEWSIPAVVFATEFEAERPGTLANAKSTLMNWHPDEYAQFYGVELTTLDSYVLRERQFKKDHANDFVVTAAWGDWHEKVPAGMVGVVARKGGDRSPGVEERWFLVPKEEYREREESFVINDTHQEWTDHA